MCAEQWSAGLAMARRYGITPGRYQKQINPQSLRRL
ncbi:hypothetical protein PANA5342_4144 [Pantoea ananatis LMG 5342]|nr:hypothetical protein PANA5342_4144 [Pantoea ananatis LMG 5342]